MSILLETQHDYAWTLLQFLSDLLEAHEHEDLQITFGDFWARDGHRAKSTHYSRLGADINFFLGDRYLRTYEDAPDLWDEIGKRWRGADPRARWGGDFRGEAPLDLNHFSFEWYGVK